MKPFALSVLYVFSIVLAVGIGMFQVGKEANDDIGSKSDNCNIVSISSTDCIQVVGKESCERTYSVGVGTVMAGTGNYQSISRQQCGDLSITRHPDRSVTESFTKDPNCKTASLTPTTDGCGE